MRTALVISYILMLISTIAVTIVSPEKSVLPWITVSVWTMAFLGLRQ